VSIRAVSYVASERRDLVAIHELRFANSVGPHLRALCINDLSPEIK